VNAQQQNRYLQVVAGTGSAGYSGDNLAATLAQVSIHSPGGGGVFGDSNGLLYFIDSGTLRVRRINIQGIVNTIAGTGALSSGNGVGGAATSVDVGYLFFVTGDTTGTFLYFSDDRYVWKYQISNGLLSRYAGAVPFSQTFNGDGQQATSTNFYNPIGVSLSTLGLLYISDRGNNRVRVVATNGFVSTFAGSGPNNDAAGSFGGDGGPAVSTNCKLNHPLTVFADTIGNVFIADGYNTRIRKVDSSGIIRTFAGGGVGSDGGPASSASLSNNNNYDVKGDRLGNIYISDQCKIRMVDTAGIISTIVGIGTCGTTMTFSPATSSVIQIVYGLWVNSNYDVYFTEVPGLIHKTVVASPTSQPSRQPSSQPSDLPSSHPSNQPSSHPSDQPSSQPSDQPSDQPSSHPSSQPSSKPSDQPSSQPSDQPSSHPSDQPSDQPSSHPSDQPSSHPSDQPSSHPSDQPSDQPSSHPSDQPSSHPSDQPSSQPSNQPSSQPSNQPSDQPFSLPSSQPSSQPSDQPSSQPSDQPSSQPSDQPSSHPSDQPSSQPSDQPSSHPSDQPSSHPSDQPSGQPSGQPSSLPSSQPSSHPSNQPSSHPSDQPSPHPSDQPSSHPSDQPSPHPSDQPSSHPSDQPSSLPSDQPSAHPSKPPFSLPSTHPSSRPSNHPSPQPSSHPSNQPSSQPSDQPSSHPSNQPSSYQSSQPSSHPSKPPFSLPSTCPLSRPSNQPAPQPSSKPTGQPSVQPTAEPTQQPYSLPTQQPSYVPSSLPTSKPSDQPRTLPTSQPSRSPTCEPTQQPSSHPSSQPAPQPSIQPSIHPSSHPSSQPTCTPTQQPSSRPTYEPSSQPTCKPSIQPSVQPFPVPSYLPICFPSSQPTSFPSGYPISLPSHCPTTLPVSHPSHIPSSLPTCYPIVKRSGKPWDPLTIMPSTTPSRDPSAQRSDRPSTAPTASSTMHPTFTPSSQPTTESTCKPFSRSTSLPSAQSSALPSARSGPSLLPSSTFKQSNFLFGVTKTSSAYRSITFPSTFLPFSASYLLLGSSELPKQFEISIPVAANVQSVSLTSSEISVDPKGIRCIALGGDFNDDKRQELLMGDPLSSKVYMFYSNRYNQLWQNMSYSLIIKGEHVSASGFGWAISSAGDFNGDGIEDVVISAIYSNKCYVLFGKPVSVNSSSGAEISVEQYLSLNITNGIFLRVQKDPTVLSFGVAVANIHDFNGDGIDDIVVSALGLNGANRMFIVFGKGELVSSITVNDPAFSPRVILLETPAYSFAGLSLSGMKDVNGDGFGDLLIGSVPFNHGYSIQQSYLVYGNLSSPPVVSLSILGKERRCSIIHGGGFMVSGIGDINNDGLADMMITSYKEWQGKVGSYLINYPTKQQWISNLPSLLPSSSPTSIPFSSVPSQDSVPSNFPTFFDSFSRVPTLANSNQTPALQQTTKPSRMPITKSPTVLPSKKPCIIPTGVPMATSLPTFLPTVYPSRPSRKFTPRPFFFPSSSPSSSVSSPGRTVILTEGGYYEGENGAEQIIIASQTNIHVKGNKGKKHFVISPSTGNSITITIEDFKSSLEEVTGQGDVLDFSELSSFTYFYSTNPLTFNLLSPNHIIIILSSHSSYDLGSENALYPDINSVNSESGFFFDVSEEFILFLKKRIFLIACVTSTFILTFFVLYCCRNRTAKMNYSGGIRNSFEDYFSGSLRSSLFGSFADDSGDREHSVEFSINYRSNDSDLDHAVMSDDNGTIFSDGSSALCTSLNSSLFGAEEELDEENYYNDIDGGEEELDEEEFYSDIEADEFEEMINLRFL
jgi:hypothetical protein